MSDALSTIELHIRDRRRCEGGVVSNVVLSGWHAASAGRDNERHDGDSYNNQRISSITDELALATAHQMDRCQSFQQPA